MVLLKKIRKKHFLFLIAIIIFLLLFYICSYLLTGRYYKIESRDKEIKETHFDFDDSIEVAGWLRVQGTSLDVPVIYSKGGKVRDYPVTQENYVWLGNNNKNFQDYISIFGHNIFNLSNEPKIKSDLFYRFEELMSFIYYDFSKENKYIQLSLNGKNYLYKIFSTGFLDLENDDHINYYRLDSIGVQERKSFVKFWKNNSLYDYSINVNENDKFITLYTCTRFFGPFNDHLFYVTGRLVRVGEFIDNYKVSKNDNYTEIQTILKGDNENEEDF